MASDTMTARIAITANKAASDVAIVKPIVLGKRSLDKVGDMGCSVAMKQG